MLWMDNVFSVRCHATNTAMSTIAYRMVEAV